MAIQIQDLQDNESELTRASFPEAPELLAALRRATSRPPFLCTLAIAGRKLVVGLAPDVVCVQHCASDGAPPYLMAFTADTKDLRGVRAFLAGGTQSEIPAKYCLSWPIAQEVVTYFAQSRGERSPLVEWKEI
jgi:hypothetical protein